MHGVLRAILKLHLTNPNIIKKQCLMNAIFLLGMCKKAKLLLPVVLLLSNTQTSFIPPMWHYGMVNIPQPQQTLHSAE